MEVCFTVKDLGVLVDTKLTMSQRCPLCKKEDHQPPGIHWVKHCKQFERGDYPSLLSAGPVLVSPVQERHVHMGVKS